MNQLAYSTGCFLPQCGESYKDYLQDALNKPKPWVGVYTAAASAACALAMAADTTIAFRTKRLWVPCNYFCMNALSLTLLSVAAKLPLDFSVVLGGVEDQLAQVSSLALMSTAIAHFITSLGSMEANEMIASLAALGLLVFTIAGDLLMRVTQISSNFFQMGPIPITIVNTPEIYETVGEVATVVFMLFEFLMSCSLAVMFWTARRYVESKYQEMHRTIILDTGEDDGLGKLSREELTSVVKRYWVMAETGSPQFVIAHSVTSIATAAVSLLSALTLLQVTIKLHISALVNQDIELTCSDYKWSTIGILATQCIGVTLGTIAPLLRLFITAQLISSSKKGHRSFKEEFKVKKYWIQLLEDWRESPLPFQIRQQKLRKLAHDAKRLLLTLCIEVQILIFRASKLLLLVSAALTQSAFRCFHLITKCKAFDSRESVATPVHDLRRFVVLLEDEEELPEKTLNNMCVNMDRMIQKGREKKPDNLINLLRKSTSFNGVREFDSKEIPSLHSPELPNCWSLPIVTLTGIAIALASIKNQDSSQLLHGVREGLVVVKLIERTLDINRACTSISKAAEVVWLRIDLYCKWFDCDLQAKEISEGQSHQHKLQELSDVAEKIVLDFKKDSDDFILENPNNWQHKAIAANCMYRITQTLMQDDKYGQQWKDEQLFDRLSIMISDILAACLTNLVRVISLKCYSHDIKERERNVHEAAILLGESEEILEILEQRELPYLDLDKAANIDEWRVDIENPHTHNATSITQNG